MQKTVVRTSAFYPGLKLLVYVNKIIESQHLPTDSLANKSLVVNIFELIAVGIVLMLDLMRYCYEYHIYNSEKEWSIIMMAHPYYYI